MTHDTTKFNLLISFNLDTQTLRELYAYCW